MPMTSLLMMNCNDERYSIERTNAWMDSFRTLLNRFDTTVSSWMAWNYLAFAVLLLKKISRKQKV